VTVVSPLVRYLLPSEVCVSAARRHWALLLPQGSVIAATWILWALILDASAGAFIQTIAAFFYVFSAVWFGWLVGEWRIEQFVVTDKRVLLISGLLYRKLAVMPLAKVTDLTYERTPLGRVLGYGTFIMESAGQDQALSKVEFLARPDQLYRALTQELFGPGGRDDGDGMTPKIRRPKPPRRPTPPTPPTSVPPVPHQRASDPTASDPTTGNRTTRLPRLR
jgi:membrane protein YdbS with pleckstrin-like domain